MTLHWRSQTKDLPALPPSSNCTYCLLSAYLKINRRIGLLFFPVVGLSLIPRLKYLGRSPTGLGVSRGHYPRVSTSFSAKLYTGNSWRTSQHSTTLDQIAITTTLTSNSKNCFLIDTVPVHFAGRYCNDTETVARKFPAGFGSKLLPEKQLILIE